MAKIDYVARETASNLWRNALMSSAAVLTVAVSLALVAGALLVKQAVSRATTQWKGGVELSIFMKPDATQDELDTVKAELAQMPEVRRTAFVSKADAFKEFQRMFADNADFRDSITADKLPPSFRVVPTHAELVDTVGERFRNGPGVLNVVYARDTIKAILRVTRFVQTLLWIVALVALVAASLLILNTIRMAIFARRREVGVMKLVGATNWFIRIPFMCEGLIQGLVGAAAALGLVAGLRILIQAPVKHIELLQQFFVTPGEVLGTGIVLLVIGGLVGTVGSAIAVSRFLDV